MPTKPPTSFYSIMAALDRAKVRMDKAKSYLHDTDTDYRATSADLGRHMKSLLSDLRVKQRTLAIRVGESDGVVSQRLSGFLAFTPDLAVQYLNAITQDHRA